MRHAPLAGIRVVDFGHAVAGPYCASMLADLGARVDKVESPSGDHFRFVQGGAIYANVNRNKRSIELDLTTENDREVAMALVEQADVVVESFVPGTADRLGVGYEQVRDRNPSVVYVSISGFGQSGPYRTKPGYDVVAQAMSGLMSATGPEGGEPVRVGTSAVDYATGAYAAFATMVALWDREHTGEGARIDASLLDSAVVWMSYWYTYFAGLGKKPQRLGTAHEMFAPYQVFATRDGAAFVGASTDRFFGLFCAAFDGEHLAADPRFASAELRCENREFLVPQVAALLAPLSTEDVLARLDAHGIPGAPVLDVEQVLADEQLAHRGTFDTVDDAALGPVAVPPFPVIIDDWHAPAGRRAPRHGEHTDEILAELGRARPETRGEDHA